MKDENLTPDEQQKLLQMAESEVESVPADMLHRFHDTIDRAAKLEQGRKPSGGARFHLSSFFWGAAITAALAVGVGIGAWIAGDEQAPGNNVPVIVDTGPAMPAGATNVAFQRSVQNHFRQSERDLSELPVYDEADRMLLIMRIVEQNRWFEKAAAQNDSEDLARVLRAFEPILVRLAANDIEPEEAEALRAKLSFELNVMLTKLSLETSDKPETTEESI